MRHSVVLIRLHWITRFALENYSINRNICSVQKVSILTFQSASDINTMKH